jgi:hypothetical protein
MVLSVRACISEGTYERETFAVPGKVMVWTAEQTGQFLDHIRGHRDPQNGPSTRRSRASHRAPPTTRRPVATRRSPSAPRESRSTPPGTALRRRSSGRGRACPGPVSPPPRGRFRHRATRSCSDGTDLGEPGASHRGAIFGVIPRCYTVGHASRISRAGCLGPAARDGCSARCRTPGRAPPTCVFLERSDFAPGEVENEGVHGHRVVAPLLSGALGFSRLTGRQWRGRTI